MTCLARCPYPISVSANTNILLTLAWLTLTYAHTLRTALRNQTWRCEGNKTLSWKLIGHRVRTNRHSAAVGIRPGGSGGCERQAPRTLSSGSASNAVATSGTVYDLIVAIEHEQDAIRGAAPGKRRGVRRRRECHVMIIARFVLFHHRRHRRACGHLLVESSSEVAVPIGVPRDGHPIGGKYHRIVN